MHKSEYLSHDDLLQQLTCNVASGIFIWNYDERKPTKWNTRYAGTTAGTVKPCGIRYIQVNGKKYIASRLIWFYVYGTWPANEIDHINGDRSDNSFANLREATHAQNMMNLKIRKDNTSGYKGVNFDARKNKFRAFISLNGRYKHIGYFNTAEEASEAYENAAAINFGNFVRAT